MDYGMNKSETARLKSEITKVYEAIIARTKDCEDSERNSALYSLQNIAIATAFCRLFENRRIII